MSNTNRQRGVNVRPLNNDALSELAVRKLRELHPDTRWEAARPTMGYALGETKSGELFLLCTEGVGWPVNAKETAALHLAASWRNERGEWFNQMSGDTLDGFTADELRAVATDEAVDLADFVRTFGARLESNFYLWHRTLTS